MDYTYQFEAHLREHRPSRLGQRLWWVPVAVGVCAIIADVVYLATTPSGRLSAALGGALPCIAGLLFLVAWVALSIADWTYPSEKYYREAHHAAASQARAYILAGRRSRGEAPATDETPAGTTHSTSPHTHLPSPETTSRARGDKPPRGTPSVVGAEPLKT